MGQIAGWITLGLLAGAVARLLLPGQDRGGWIATTLLGIVGALVGGWLAQSFGLIASPSPSEWLPSPKSIVPAIVGSIVVLALWKCLKV